MTTEITNSPSRQAPTPILTTVGSRQGMSIYEQLDELIVVGYRPFNIPDAEKHLKNIAKIYYKDLPRAEAEVEAFVNSYFELVKPRFIFTGETAIHNGARECKWIDADLRNKEADLARIPKMIGTQSMSKKELLLRCLFPVLLMVMFMSCSIAFNGMNAAKEQFMERRNQQQSEDNGNE